MGIMAILHPTPTPTYTTHIYAFSAERLNNIPEGFCAEGEDKEEHFSKSLSS
jgi:hypothetical protein